MSDYGEDGADDDGAYNGEYEGNRNERNERHGYGKAILPNRDLYDGRYMNGKRDGYGVYKFMAKAAKHARYTGEYYQGRKQGTGIFLYPDGSRYEGQWVNDLKEGTGTYFYVNGDTYEGDWFQNLRHGNGTYTYKHSFLKYTGSWYKGKFNDYGSIVYPNYKYCGRFRSNKPFGQGKFVFDTCCEIHGKYTLPSKREAQFSDIEQEAALLAIERALAGGGEDGEVTLEDMVVPGTPPEIVEETRFIPGETTALHVMTEEENQEAKLIDELRKLKEKLKKQIDAKKDAERQKQEKEAARIQRVEAERAALENQAVTEMPQGAEEAGAEDKVVVEDDDGEENKEGEEGEEEEGRGEGEAEGEAEEDA